MAWQNQANTWTNVESSSNVFCGIHLRVVLTKLFRAMSSEITLLKLLSSLPGAI